jgi:diguanylate cyclase (GGDEF)-like protein
MKDLPTGSSTNKRAMVNTAAALYGAATLDGALEGLLPGDPAFAAVPVVAVAVVLAGLLAFGPRLPRVVLVGLGPLGVALTAYAVATSPQPGDGAILYAMPVLWSTMFFGVSGAVGIVSCVAVGQLVALLVLPPEVSNPARWLDVMVAVTAISIVVLSLERRSEMLVKRLAGEARTDALTGLLNRRGFEERATVELAHARRQSTSLAVMMLDIDHFKRINDAWGHETGDDVLTRIAELLVGECREIDVVARVGGEEFVILMPGADEEGAHPLWERIQHATHLSPADGLPEAYLSAGITEVRGTDLEELLAQADAALYEAKRAGRDRAVTFQADSPLACPGPSKRGKPSSGIGSHGTAELTHWR